MLRGGRGSTSRATSVVHCTSAPLYSLASAEVRKDRVMGACTGTCRGKPLDDVEAVDVSVSDRPDVHTWLVRSVGYAYERPKKIMEAAKPVRTVAEFGLLSEADICEIVASAELSPYYAKQFREAIEGVRTAAAERAAWGAALLRRGNCLLFDELPVDLLDAVLTRLDTLSMLDARCVSRSWRDRVLAKGDLGSVERAGELWCSRNGKHRSGLSGATFVYSFEADCDPPPKLDRYQSMDPPGRYRLPLLKRLPACRWHVVDSWEDAIHDSLGYCFQVWIASTEDGRSCLFSRRC